MVEQILQELSRIEGVLGNVVVSKDGLVITSQLNSPVDVDILAAWSVSALNLAQRYVGELDGGHLLRCLIETQEGSILLSNMKTGSLITITSAQVNLGLLRLKLEDAVKALEKLSEFP